MRRRLFIFGGIGAAALVALGIGAWFLFFSDDAPDEVDNAAANEQLDRELAAADGDDDGADDTSADGDDEGIDDPPTDDTMPAAPATDINREWTVDNTIGTFEFDSASGSFAGFRVDEELTTIGSATAVGRTDAVTGSITIVDGELTAADLVVDLTGIVSNNARRERAIQRALDTGDFPEATFLLTEPVALPAGLVERETVEVEATGDLTIHGVTNQATFSLTANVRDDGIAVVTGSSAIVFADYGVSAPSAPVVVSVDDNGIVELQLLLI